MSAISADGRSMTSDQLLAVRVPISLGHLLYLDALQRRDDRAARAAVNEATTHLAEVVAGRPWSCSHRVWAVYLLDDLRRLSRQLDAWAFWRDADRIFSGAIAELAKHRST